MSSLPNTIPTIAAPQPADRTPARTEDTSRVRDDDRFSDRLDRERTRADETAKSDSSRSDRTREDSTPPESSRSDATERTDAPSQSRSSDDLDDQAITETDGEEALADPAAQTPEVDPGTTDSGIDPALALIAEAETTETPELTITARSGETINLTPPTTSKNGQGEPGSLGRWFVEASGAISSDLSGQLGPMAGLLSKTMTTNPLNSAETPDLASLIGQGAQAGQKLAGPAASDAVNMPDQAMSFADAMASANASTETMDTLMSQAMAKAATTLDADIATPTPVTPGPTVATGAQPTMTAVPQAAAGQAVPVTALAVEINRQAMSGKTQFEIRLDPPELGRLNVRLEVDSNGQTRTHMVVERSETLDMLTTDSRSLERALQQAGMKAEPGSVTFELAQDFNEGLAQNGDQPETSNPDGTSDDNTAQGDDTLVPELTDMSSVEAVRQQLYLTGHLDVRV